MVLEFPVLADYMLLFDGTCAIYATHGHVYNEKNLPPMKKGDVLLHGHTHVLRAERRRRDSDPEPRFCFDSEGGQSADVCGAGGWRISNSHV